MNVIFMEKNILKSYVSELWVQFESMFNKQVEIKTSRDKNYKNKSFVFPACTY
jgi:hypothetical protein